MNARPRYGLFVCTQDTSNGCRDRRRIQLPAWHSGFPTSARGSNDTVMAQGGELLGVHAQPRAEYVVDMLAKQRRRLDRRRCTVETHWPSRHLDLAGRGVVDRLHDAALGERRVVHQLQGVEHRPAGTPAAPNNLIASSLVCCRVQAAMISSTSAPRWLRAA